MNKNIENYIQEFDSLVFKSLSTYKSLKIIEDFSTPSNFKIGTTFLETFNTDIKSLDSIVYSFLKNIQDYFLNYTNELVVFKVNVCNKTVDQYYSNYYTVTNLHEFSKELDSKNISSYLYVLRAESGEYPFITLG